MLPSLMAIPSSGRGNCLAKHHMHGAALIVIGQLQSVTQKVKCHSERELHLRHSEYIRKSCKTHVHSNDATFKKAFIKLFEFSIATKRHLGLKSCICKYIFAL